MGASVRERARLARLLFARFDGYGSAVIVAEKLGLAPATIRVWKNAGRVPARHIEAVRRLLEEADA